MNERNLWLTQTLNRWIALSQWKYIARIDDDDIWHDKDKLKKQVEFMEANPEYWLCGTWVILINEEWKEIDAIVNRWWDENIRNAISWSNQFTHSSIMMKKSIVETVWCYHDTNITKYAEDYDLWLRIGLVAKFDNVQDYCIKYRVRKWSISGKKRIHQAFNAFRVYLQYRNNYPNQITWIIKHLITVFVPQSIVNVLVKLYR
jgi:glycosyltransferase involved in cell wall biosynthesis